MTNNFKSSDILKFHVTNNHFTSDGFSLGGTTCSKDEIVLYETIDLEEFPSCNDFKGKQTIVKHGEYCIVLKKIGRPWRINQDSETWSEYDVYEVLTLNLNICHVFGALLESTKYMSSI